MNAALHAHKHAQNATYTNNKATNEVSGLIKSTFIPSREQTMFIFIFKVNVLTYITLNQLPIKG